MLLENLACKATVMATARCSATATARQVDYLLNSGEAVGDRYQRGGSLSKAVGEVVGCVNATRRRHRLRRPVHALIMASAMVAAGLHRYVVVLGGGAQAKLG